MSQEELLEKTAASRLTRRTIVSTGTKLAYAAPVMAASIKLSGRGASAQATPTPGTGGVRTFCGHSVQAIDNGPITEDWGCMQACKAQCAGGDTTDNSDPCSQVCNTLCPIGTNDRECLCDEACDTENFSCLSDGDVAYNGAGACDPTESVKFP